MCYWFPGSIYQANKVKEITLSNKWVYTSPKWSCIICSNVFFFGLVPCLHWYIQLLENSTAQHWQKLSRTLLYITKLTTSDLDGGVTQWNGIMLENHLSTVTVKSAAYFKCRQCFSLIWFLAIQALMQLLKLLSTTELFAWLRFIHVPVSHSILVAVLCQYYSLLATCFGETQGCSLVNSWATYNYWSFYKCNH